MSVKGEGVGVVDLRRQGIEVDDDNKPAHENAEPTTMNPGNAGGWPTSTTPKASSTRIVGRSSPR